ncbi:MAG: hypothetical protein RLZZ26_348 [Candidatus Parcubacteria bacterium]
MVWVTTEKDLVTYMDSRRTAVSKSSVKNPLEWARRMFAKRHGPVEMSHLANRILSIAVVVTVLLFLLLFYIFSSSLEQLLNQNALHTIEKTPTS